MSRSDLQALRKLGLYLHEEFLSPTDCRRLLLDAQAGEAEAATIVDKCGNVIVDQGMRRAESFGISDGVLRETVRGRFAALQPNLETYFGVTLVDCEAPYIVRYPIGGFYRPHGDNDCKARASADERKVSCVLFLNGSAAFAKDECFVGGALAFFRLGKNETAEGCKSFLHPIPALLVAFRSATCHEVLPVMAGCRWTLVTWFH
jgi:predicted 2-oxoglutarate/Fe(II)-dependent dioxygenase YbiX